jgi:hypothetical protein
MSGHVFALPELRAFHNQLQRIPKTELGAMVKKVLMKELGVASAYKRRFDLVGHFEPRKRGPRDRTPVKVTVECFRCEKPRNAVEFPLNEVRKALIGQAAICTECRKQPRKTEVEIAKTA